MKADSDRTLLRRMFLEDYLLSIQPILKEIVWKESNGGNREQLSVTFRARCWWNLTKFRGFESKLIRGCLAISSSWKWNLEGEPEQKTSMNLYHSKSLFKTINSTICFSSVTLVITHLWRENYFFIIAHLKFNSESDWLMSRMKFFGKLLNWYLIDLE